MRTLDMVVSDSVITIINIEMTTARIMTSMIDMPDSLLQPDFAFMDSSVMRGRRD